MSLIKILFKNTLKRNIMVSDKHLASGSVDPPMVDGLIRVYSMKVCPFAKRTRILLKEKKIPHEIININLLDKPDWYFRIHPKGLVPAIIDKNKTIIESLDIADYLDETYPTENPLYPADPVAKKRDQFVIRELGGSAIHNLIRALYTTGSHTVEQTVEYLLPVAQPLEDELANRDTLFFGGNRPGMIDYMLWPWAELIEYLPDVIGVKETPLKDIDIPKLRNWRDRMLHLPLIQELQQPPGLLLEAIQAKRSGIMDYTKLFNE